MAKSVIQCLKDIAYKLGLIADYVVETGTSGIWVYQKFHSGIVKLWGKKTYTNLAISTSYANSHYRATLAISFPFTLTSVDYGNVNVAGQGIDWASFKPIDNTKFNFYWCNAASYTVTTGQATFHVIGKWKQLGGVVRHLIWRWSYV